MICPNCRHKNAPGWKYCIACGSKLKSNGRKTTASSKKSHAKSKKENGFSKRGLFFLNSALVLLIGLGIAMIVTVYGKDIENMIINQLDVRKTFDGSDWKRFEVADGKYSVITPSDPKGQKIIIPIPNLHKEIPLYSYTDPIDSDNMISYAYGEYPSDMDVSDPSRVFDVLVNASLLNSESQGVDYQEEEFLGYPAVEFSGKTLDEKDRWYMRSLIILKGRSVYMLSSKNRSEDFDGFNTLKNSFKLDK